MFFPAAVVCDGSRASRRGRRPSALRRAVGPPLSVERLGPGVAAPTTLRNRGGTTTSDAEARGLADLLDRCSKQSCDLAGKLVAVTTATAADFARGRDLFVGRTPLAAGAVPCLACHTVRGAAGRVPGGALAKDVYARLGDQGPWASGQAKTWTNPRPGWSPTASNEAPCAVAWTWTAPFTPRCRPGVLSGWPSKRSVQA